MGWQQKRRFGSGEQRPLPAQPPAQRQHPSAARETRTQHGHGRGCSSSALAASLELEQAPGLPGHPRAQADGGVEGGCQPPLSGDVKTPAD